MGIRLFNYEDRPEITADDSDAFNMVNYSGQEAKGFFFFFLQLLVQDVSFTLDAPGPMGSCDGWMCLVLAGEAALNANCFEGQKNRRLL